MSNPLRYLRNTETFNPDYVLWLEAELAKRVPWEVLSENCDHLIALKKTGHNHWHCGHGENKSDSCDCTPENCPLTKGE